MRRVMRLATILLALVAVGSSAEADWVLTTLGSFNGSNGSAPRDSLIADAQGNLYGTTSAGGANGSGTVFKLTTGTSPNLAALSSFNGTNGATPFGGLIADAQGNLYGTTVGGGANNDGTVFKLTTGANPTLTTVASFNGGDGSRPYGGLIIDTQGNVYGTTSGGGANGDGTVFKLTPGANPTLTTLATFNGANGNLPTAGLLADGQGNLYGTTEGGGAHGDGTVFKLTTGGIPTLTTLASFSGSNGISPFFGSLIADAQGNLYGTTDQGGANGDGTVFKLTTGVSPTLTTLASFNGSNGSTPTK